MSFITSKNFTLVSGQQIIVQFGHFTDNLADYTYFSQTKKLNRVENHEYHYKIDWTNKSEPT